MDKNVTYKPLVDRTIFLIMVSIAVAMAALTEVAVHHSFVAVDVWPMDSGVDVYGSVIMGIRTIVVVLAVLVFAWGFWRKCRCPKDVYYFVLLVALVAGAAVSRSVVLVPLDSVYRYYVSVPSVATYTTIAAVLLCCDGRRQARLCRAAMVPIYMILLGNAAISSACLFWIYPVMIARYLP